MKSIHLSLFILIIFTIGCTATGSDSKVKFALLTDLHVSPGQKSDIELNALVDDVNKQAFDFVVVTGDISNTGSNEELDAVKRELDRLHYPYYIIPGNHETNWSESACQYFNELWGTDRFEFTKGNFQFIGFDTGPYMKMGDGHVKQEDLYWMNHVLSEKMKGDQKLISFSHYPLADGLDNWPEVTELLKRYDCRLDFCGHGHHYQIFNFDGILGIMSRSMSMRNSDKPGYSIVELKNDSVYVKEKEVGVREKPVVFALDYLSPDTLESIASSPYPDYSVNEKYQQVKVAFELTDTASIFTGPCLVGDSLLVYGNSLGWLKCYNITENKIVWQKQFQGAFYSTPVNDGRIVMVGNTDGFYYGLSLENGNPIWKVNMHSPVLAEGTVDDGFVYVGGGTSGMYKIDTQTGERQWRNVQPHGLIQAKATIIGKNLIFGAWDCFLYDIDKESGKLIWKWTNGKKQKLFSPGNVVPVIGGHKVFIVAPDRYMTAVDLDSGREIWRTNCHKVRESIGISPDKTTIYAKLMNDSIIAVSTRYNTFHPLWQVDAGIGYDHNPCPILQVNDQVIGATKNGMLVAVAATGKQILWKYKAGNSSVNKIVHGPDDRLWISLTEGRILAISIAQ